MSINPRFDEYHLNVFGDRWAFLAEALKQAGLKQNKVSVGLKTGCSKDFIFSQGSMACIPREVGGHYQLDLASVLAVSALNLNPGAKILDLCAAPGGKALVSQLVVGGEGEWHLNELSQGRLSRLKSVIREFSPVHQDSLHFYKRDASKWGLTEKNIYDFVICDVPCSGEAHLLNSPSHLKRWTPRSSKNLAVRQHAILCAALETVRPGGKILYSTCSINPQENDGIIQRLLKKRMDRVEIIAPTLSGIFSGEPTQYGVEFFPDKCEYGPIYFSVLKKI